MIVIVRGDWYMIINNNTTRKNRRQSAERGGRGSGEGLQRELDSAQARQAASTLLHVLGWNATSFCFSNEQIPQMPCTAS